MNALKFACVAALLVLPACGGSEFSETTQDDGLGEREGEATSEVTAKVDGFTVYLHKTLTSEVRDGRPVFVLKGRASKNLSGAHSFVFDDPFGVTTVVSARKFEVVLDARYEMNSLVAGTRLFLSLGAASGDHATAGLLLTPSFENLAGSSRIWVNGPVSPVYSGGLVLRGRARTGQGSRLAVKTDDGVSLAVANRAGSATEWNVNLSYEQFQQATDEAADKLSFTYSDEAFVDWTKTGVLRLSVADLGLTRGDAESQWPMDSCSASVQSCLDALPAGSSETESCGSYRQVTRCNLPDRLPQLGTAPDDRSAIDAELARIRSRLGPGKTVSVRNFYVQGTSSRAPSLATVVRAFVTQEQNPDLVNDGAITNTQVTQDLSTHGAQGLVGAARTTVYQQSYQGARVRWERTTAPSSLRKVRLELLYFAGAARLVVVELADET